MDCKAQAVLSPCNQGLQGIHPVVRVMESSWLIWVKDPWLLLNDQQPLIYGTWFLCALCQQSYPRLNHVASHFPPPPENRQKLGIFLCSGFFEGSLLGFPFRYAYGGHLSYFYYYLYLRTKFLSLFYSKACLSFKGMVMLSLTYCFSCFLTSR